MNKTRLEAFSDAVIAVAITIMVLELKVPHEASIAALIPLVPKFLSYFLSFIYIGIYWNNHHHMFQVVHRVSGAVLWANLHLLFWLTLVPFTTGWMGENNFAPIPIAVYGLDLLMCAIAYYILQYFLIKMEGPDSELKKALATDYKGKLSPLIYTSAIISSFWFPLLSLVLYTIGALIWFIPDRRIENFYSQPEHEIKK